jgi:GTP-binding protein
MIFTAREIEIGRKLFAGEFAFFAGADKPDALPKPNGIEVAFAGRSNVGKSSLINALTNRKALARVSITPGRTQQINFFQSSGPLVLVDLPGYGFAKAAKTDTRKFQNLGRAYLQGRPNLKRAYLLIDSRHGLKDVDEEAMKAFDIAAVSYQIVLTKADKISAKEVEAVTARTLAAISRRPAAYPRVIATSAEKGTGLPMLRAEVAHAWAI